MARHLGSISRREWIKDLHRVTFISWIHNRKPLTIGAEFSLGGCMSVKRTWNWPSTSVLVLAIQNIVMTSCSLFIVLGDRGEGGGGIVRDYYVNACMGSAG